MTARATDDGREFVVRYTGAKIGYLLRRVVPVYLLFVVLLCLYLNDETRQMLSKDREAPITPIGLFILGSFLVAALADLVLTIATFRRGRPALVIGKDGVEGPILYRTQRFGWADISEVFAQGGEVIIERKPKTWIEAQTVRRAPPGSRHRMTALLRTPLACVDRSAAEISAALREYAPADLAQTLRCRLD